LHTQEEYETLKKKVCPNLLSSLLCLKNISTIPYLKLTCLILFIQTTSSSSGAQNEDAAKEIADLKKQLGEAKKVQRDFGMLFLSIEYVLLLTHTGFYVTDILKKQASQNNAEYDRLATELNAVTGQDKSNKRVD
jgi:hypothetical protein